MERRIISDTSRWKAPQKTNGFIYSARSERILRTCDRRIRDLMILALKISPFDIRITSGYRTPEEQNQIFKDGNSQLDGYERLSKHNATNKFGEPESKAVDFLLRVRRGDKFIWKYKKENYQYYTYIWGLLDGYDHKIHELFRWGGDWDRDYEFYSDHRLKDPYHIELR